MIGKKHLVRRSGIGHGRSYPKGQKLGIGLTAPMDSLTFSYKRGFENEKVRNKISTSMDAYQGLHCLLFPLTPLLTREHPTGKK